MYDGFIDKRNIDMNHAEEFSVEDLEGRFFTFIAHHTAMKRDLKVVVWQMVDGKTKVLFSTDTSMSGIDVLTYYRTRFQIEFCFRDAKEYTGLCDCQARSKDKLDFAFNASLFTVNTAKVLHKLRYVSANEQVLSIQLAAIFRYKSERSISMSTFKSLMVNQYLCKRIISMSEIHCDLKFIKLFNQALVDLELDAC